MAEIPYGTSIGLGIWLRFYGSFGWQGSWQSRCCFDTWSPGVQKGTEKGEAEQQGLRRLEAGWHWFEVLLASSTPPQPSKSAPWNFQSDATFGNMGGCEDGEPAVIRTYCA